MRKLTMLFLCSAATASPKAIKSKTKTVMSKSFEAMVESEECCREQNNVGFIHSLSLCVCVVFCSVFTALCNYKSKLDS